MKPHLPASTPDVCPICGMTTWPRNTVPLDYGWRSAYLRCGTAWYTDTEETP